MKSIGAEFLQPDVLPGINHMREIQYEIVANVWWRLCAELCHCLLWLDA